MRTGALALNMIVGPNESGELRRCLESYHARDTFDEIVIVRTTHDAEVEAVAREYTEKTPYYAWSTERHPHGDFAGARNAALDITDSDWVWWLDADDVCVEEFQEKLSRVRENILSRTDTDAEAFMMEYIIRERLNGGPSCSFWRPRIFRRVPKHHWRNAAHENFDPPQWYSNDRLGHIRGFANTHRPMKMQRESALRNVRILGHEYNHYRDEMDDDLVYFYGRDLLFAGRPREGIDILIGLIDRLTLPLPTLAAAAVDIMLYFAYGQQCVCPSLDLIPEDKLGTAEQWARVALALDPQRAEAITVLADVYLRRGQRDAAERLYRVAITAGLRIQQDSTRVGLKALLFSYYDEIPNTRLTEIMVRKGLMENALLHASLACNANPGDGTLLKRRGDVIHSLVEDQRGRSECLR